jgi:3-oxoadipate enol-lactonase
MGGLIALRMALSHNSRIDALILMSTTAGEESAEGNAATTQVRDIWVSTPSPSEEIMNIAIQGWGGDPDVNGPRAQRIKRDWVERHSGAERVDPVLQSVAQRENLLGRLHEITVPVLIVHGQLDATWSLEHAANIQNGLVNAKVIMKVVRDSGHLVVWMRDSEDVSRMMADFVNNEVVLKRH